MMLSRIVAGSGLLLILLLLSIFLVNGAPSAVRAALPLTPPPIAPQLPFGPRTDAPSPPLTTTAIITPTAIVTPTVVLTPTPTSAATSALLSTPTTPSTTSTAPIIVITPTVTPAPTVTPTVVSTVTVATVPPTATLTATATTVTTATASIPRAVIVTATRTGSGIPTVTPTAPALVLLPTPTPTRLAIATPTAQATLLPLATSTPTTTLGVGVPVTSDTTLLLPPFVTATVPLPPSYEAVGSFASQTVYTDSTIAQQQGTFTIIQAAALNEYGANQHYTLSTQRAVGVKDEINVYQIDRYIAVNYTGGDWMVVRRDQGSNIVRAIQPITDLAVLFPRVINQAEFIGQEEINGIPALRYRIDDPTGQGARLVQPLLALTGEIRSLRLDVWIAVPGGYVVAYNFQVELAAARVLDANGNEVRADQAVTWTYQLTPNENPPAIAWPEDAPAPDAFPVPGFAAGAFPIPPETELLALVGGVPDLVSRQTPVEVDSFYRTEFFNLGWTVEGEGGLLRVSKDGTSFQLLITEDSSIGGTRISILPAE